MVPPKRVPPKLAFKHNPKWKVELDHPQLAGAIEGHFGPNARVMVQPGADIGRPLAVIQREDNYSIALLQSMNTGRIFHPVLYGPRGKMFAALSGNNAPTPIEKLPYFFRAADAYVTQMRSKLKPMLKPKPKR